jgi:uncharacterized membrane protein YjjB (DUF3815 family)
MRKIKHLKARWLLTSMVLAVVAGELLASFIGTTFGVRVPAVPVAAFCIGLVAVITSLIYDGED